MDLVADDEEVALDGDPAEGLELRSRPDAPRRIVGAAEDEQPSRSVDPGPQVVEVHRVAPAVEAEGVADDPAAVVLDGVIEGVIDGRLDDDRVAGAGEGPDDIVQGRHDPGGHGDPVLLDRPAVSPTHPADGGLEERGRREGVSEDAVFDPPPQGFDHGRRGLEVHVGHPQGDGVLDAEDPAGVDPLHGLGPRPVDDLIEGGHDTRFPLFLGSLQFAHVLTSSHRFPACHPSSVGAPRQRETGIMSPIKGGISRS